MTYVTRFYKLTPGLAECNISNYMQLELFFKIEYVCEIPKGLRMEQDLAQFAVKIMCDDSTGCDEVDNHFATEANTSIDILYEYDLDVD